MVMASQLAVSRGALNHEELQRIMGLLSAFDLPVAPPAQMSIADFMPYMKTDKKVQAGKMRFIVPTALGQSAIVDDVTEQELMALFSI
jgi:3-dehydroquinate synthase